MTLISLKKMGLVKAIFFPKIIILSIGSLCAVFLWQSFNSRNSITYFSTSYREASESFFQDSNKKTQDTNQVHLYSLNTNTKSITVKKVLIPPAANLPVLQIEAIQIDSVIGHSLEIGMVNVTDNRVGYKIVSGNGELKLIAIKFAKTEIPNGYSIGDVHTYFYNEEIHHWQQLKRDSVDVYNEIIYSTNTEDGDYINAIIKSPEAPETAGFVPTTLNDLKLGDPSSMVQLIQVPTANDQGSASVSFHILTEKGRQGIQPNLDVKYNSDGGNGIMGLGWNLSGVSSIAVETRWGVPQYLTGEESETYLLDGEMLAMKDPNDKLSMAHRQLGIPRTGTTRGFVCRRERNFNDIKRIGSLRDYIWVITDNNGTKYYYGGVIGADGTNIVDAVLREGNKIAEWKLRKVVDLFNNSMEFYYEEKSIGSNPIRSIYLKQILYTLYRDDKQLRDVRKVEFTYDTTARRDFGFSARYGFLSSETASLLTSIKTSWTDYRNDNSERKKADVRKYDFHYRYGSYSKIVLDSISQLGFDGDTEKPFCGQRFKYFSIDSLTGNYFRDASVSLPTNADDMLGKSETKAKLGFGGAVGIGAPDFQFTSKSISFDAQFSYKENESESMVSFIDITGDGKPDIIRKNNKTGNITYRSNLSTADSIKFGTEYSVTGISSFGKDDGSSNGFGAEVNGPTQSRIYSGFDNNTTNSYSKSYFTDANGDGLIDIVENGEVKFNTYGGRAGAIVFEKTSARTPCPITNSKAAIGNDLVTEDNARMTEELNNNIKISPLHDVVRLWIAPDTGTIRINAPANLIMPVLGKEVEDSAVYRKADGVFVSVQQNSAYIFPPVKISRGSIDTVKVAIPSLQVNKGDKILFRVQSGNTPTSNGSYDQVQWNPSIAFISKNSNRHFIDPFSRNQFQYNALDDHLYNNEAVQLPYSGKYTIAGKFIKPHTKDAVTLTIKLSGSFIKDSLPDSTLTIKRPDPEKDTTINIKRYIYTVRDSVFSKQLDTSAQSFATNFPIPQEYSYNSTLAFEITPSSNFDLTEIDWKPQINYEYYDTTETKPSDRWKKDTVTFFPKLNFKGQLFKSGIFVKVKDSGEVKISPIITLKGNVSATLVISDKENVLLRKQISHSQYLADTISFIRDKGQYYTVHYEINSPTDIDTTIAAGKIPSYLLIPNDYNKWVVPQTGVYSFFSVKKGALSGSVIKINSRDSLPHNRDTLANILLKENDIIVFEDTVNHSSVPFSTILSQASAVFHKWFRADSDSGFFNDYGKLYRGWGQGVFNATNNLSSPIDINKFRLTQIKRANFYETEFFSMPFDVNTNSYTGVNKRIYINKDTLSPSRMAMADVSPDTLFNVSSNIDASGARAVIKYTKSTSTSKAFGGFGVTVNESKNGKTTSYSDYIDLNGDRYPDIAGQNAVQFTNSLGGLRGTATTIAKGTGLLYSEATSWGLNLGGVFFHPFLAGGKSGTQKSNNVSTASSKIASVLNGLSGGYNENDDNVQTYLYDFNGDGLPDRVTGKNVYINIGDRFLDQSMNWEIKNIQGNKSKTIGGSGGFNYDNNSGAAGINLAQTTTNQNSLLIDFNGDGLLDNLVRKGDNTVVYLNTGNILNISSGQQIDLGKSLDVGKSVANSRGINGAYTFSPHIFAVLVPVCKIVFNVSANIGDGNNSVKSQWVDINGDGFVDYVSYDNNTANVSLSNLGKINRLKTVSGPLGGQFDIDYKYVVGDYHNPGGKWVIGSVVSDDGIADDGKNAKTVFDYDDGNYDRYEREFLGFKRTTATDYLEDKPYRKAIAEYNNQNYFIAHLVAKRWQEDALGKKYQYEEYEYFEKFRNRASQTNVSVPTPASLLTVAVMQNPLRSKKFYTYEGKDFRLLLNQTSYKYDSLLNVISYEYIEGNTSAQQDNSYYKADITYRKKENNPYVYGLLTSIIIKNKGGEILKKVEASYPLGVYKNKMKSETVFYNNNTSATTTYLYDDRSGNLIRKTYANGLRDTFEFDGPFDTYITKIKDAYNLENEFEYDWRFGTEIKKTLTSGESIKTKYDEFGRVTKVQGPRQSLVDIDDADYTIKIAYNLIPGKSYSLVKHFDESHPDDGIYTISFVDGFNKNTQIKKTGVVNGVPKWLVGGRQFYDDVYRQSKAFYPSVQDYDVSADMVIGNAGVTLKKDTSKIPASVTSYDILDRVVDIRLPNGKLFEHNNYAIKKDGFNNDAQVTTTTYGNDARLNKKEKYINGAALASTEKFYLKAENDSLYKITKYQYDPIHRAENIYNVHNGTEYLVIKNKYDWDGRKTTYYNVSGGTTSYEYDKLGNLDKRINAKGDVIDYDYQHKRLIRIRYPKHPEDSVRYVYGEKAAPLEAHSIGRIVFQIDATGAQSFRYDEYGNLKYNTRTIVAPFDTTYTFTSQFTYDSWGRLLNMVYPSGESVDYKYNTAGNLINVSGSKYASNVVSFKYVNHIVYDEFEQRKSIVYGNDLITNYSYEDTLRRLSSVQTIKNGNEIMLSTYKYDELNNITQNTNRSKLDLPETDTVKMKHEYAYDNQNQLMKANGTWSLLKKTSATWDAASTYSLNLAYDDQMNISNKELNLISPQITRKVTSEFGYKNADPLQLDFVRDRIIRENHITSKNYKEVNTAYHNYDKDGNDMLVNMADSFQNNVNERKILWDEENRIRAISSNGYVSSYTYDASGARTIKLSNEIEGVYINGQFAGDFTTPASYSLYVSPYFSVRNARGIGTKHIYIGEERIVSQLTNYTSWPTGNNEASAKHPNLDTLKLTENLAPKNKYNLPVRYFQKMAKVEALINGYFDSLQLPHKTIAHNAFQKEWPTLKYPVVANPADQFKTGSVLSNVDGDEKLRYFYHRNQIGSSSFISDREATIVQYVEYLPFGETFRETRKDYSSQFLFNGKEQDQETGLYYYGARYYDPQTYQWLSVDPMAEKFPGTSPYTFSFNNPIRMLDRNGMEASDELSCYYNNENDNSGRREWLYKLDQLDKPIEPSYLIENAIGAAGLAKGAVSLGRWAFGKFATQEAAEVLPGLATEFNAVRGGHSLVAQGLGSTGRTEATNLVEQMAMKEAMANPQFGKVLENMKPLSDPRWPGWLKMQYSIKTKDGVNAVIHYVGKWENGVLKAVDDFKFK